MAPTFYLVPTTKSPSIHYNYSHLVRKMKHRETATFTNTVLLGIKDAVQLQIPQLWHLHYGIRLVRGALINLYLYKHRSQFYRWESGGIARKEMEKQPWSEDESWNGDWNTSSSPTIPGTSTFPFILLQEKNQGFMARSCLYFFPDQICNFSQLGKHSSAFIVCQVPCSTSAIEELIFLWRYRQRNMILLEHLKIVTLL